MTSWSTTQGITWCHNFEAGMRKVICYALDVGFIHAIFTVGCVRTGESAAPLSQQNSTMGMAKTSKDFSTWVPKCGQLDKESNHLTGVSSVYEVDWVISIPSNGPKSPNWGHWPPEGHNLANVAQNWIITEDSPNHCVRHLWCGLSGQPYIEWSETTNCGHLLAIRWPKSDQRDQISNDLWRLTYMVYTACIEWIEWSVLKRIVGNHQLRPFSTTRWPKFEQHCRKVNIWCYSHIY